MLGEIDVDALARSFATGRRQLVGILTKYAPGAFTVPVMIGANTYLGTHDMAVLFSDAKVEPAAMLDYAHDLRARRINGLLIIGDGPRTKLRSVTPGLGVRWSTPSPRATTPRTCRSCQTTALAGRLAAEHLIDTGRIKIAHITVAGDRAAEARAEGLASALAEAGLPLAGGRPWDSDTWHRRGGVAAARRLLEHDVDFDALFCANDQIAFGACHVLRSAGRRIPEDIAIVGSTAGKAWSAAVRTS